MCVHVNVSVNSGIKMRQVMDEGEDGYFSGDQIPVFICELLLCHRLSRNVFGLLSLGLRFKYGWRSERQRDGKGWLEEWKGKDKRWKEL